MRTARALNTLLAAAALGGCIDNTGATAPDDDTGGPDAGAAARLPDGTHGSDRVWSRGELVDLPWVVRDGLKYVEDDWDIGPAIAARTLSGVSLTINPWTDGVVPYCVVEQADNASIGLDTAKEAIVDQALVDLEAITPLDFQKFDCQASSKPSRYIDYQQWTTNYSKTGAGIGHTGNTIQLAPNIGERTVWHETGHALGFMHEQRRYDRGSFVNYYPACLDDPTKDDQFTLSTDVATDRLTPYDIDSVMQYPSSSFSKDDPACPTLLSIIGGSPYYGSYSGVGSMYGTYINKSSEDSAEDLNAIYQVYEPELGTSEANDNFGTAVVAGDFDGDGYTDLAVGATGEAPGSSAVKSGAVLLYKGTMNGLTAWKLIKEQSYPGASAQTNDAFGSTLAAGDIDGDGDDDLFVGAFYYGASHGGAVFTYLGGRGGPTPAGTILTQSGSGAGTSEIGDYFGWSIAVGKFAGGSTMGLAVGAPYEKQTGTGSRGVVSVFKYAGSGGFSYWKNVWASAATTAHDGDLFGNALAAVDINHDGATDLFIGAPQTYSGAGFVAPFFGSSTGMIAGALLPTPSSPGTGDRFGAALASGQTAFMGPTELVVGAPGRNSGAGRAYEYTPSGSGTTMTFTLSNTLKQSDISGQTGYANDGFGTKIALADLDGDNLHEIIVSVPDKTVSSVAGAGAIFIFSVYGLDHVLTASTPQSWDEFGYAFVPGNFNAGYDSATSDYHMDLAVGLPWRTSHSASAAGVVNTYKGTSLSFWRQLNEEITGGP